MKLAGRLMSLAACSLLAATASAQVVSVYGTDGSRTDFEAAEISNINFKGYEVVHSAECEDGKDLASTIQKQSDLQVMGRLLAETSWADSLKAYCDKDYENSNKETTSYISGIGSTSVPAYRYIGFTALVETDDVYEREWGVKLVKDAAGNVTNWDAALSLIKEKCQAVYGTEQAADLTHPDNAVNRFVAYHLLYGGANYWSFVRHFNEYNYKYEHASNPQTVNCPTNVWDYYTTMGKHRGLIKITQVGDAGFEHDVNHTMYANRISLYDNGRTGDYHETGVIAPGVSLHYNDKATALNGYVYNLNSLLLYSDEVRSQLASERMRIDVVTMLPEILTNNMRGGSYKYLPNGYCSNIVNASPGTNLLYLTAAGGWYDYQGDEFLVTGQYDFTLRLPPVPQDGTYEIRMGTSMNNARSIAQAYFGTSPQNLSPAGLPIDQRQSVTDNPAIPWVADTEDNLVNLEVDRNLRNQGFMKAPNYFTMTDGTAEVTCRTWYNALRQILLVANMKADETYYIRFKSLLNNNYTQFFMDYFELVPASVFMGEEDIW